MTLEHLRHLLFLKAIDQSEPINSLIIGGYIHNSENVYRIFHRGYVYTTPIAKCVTPNICVAVYSNTIGPISKLCYTVGFFTNTAIRWDDTLAIYDRGYELVLMFDDC